MSEDKVMDGRRLRWVAMSSMMGAVESMSDLTGDEVDIDAMARRLELEFESAKRKVMKAKIERGGEEEGEPLVIDLDSEEEDELLEIRSVVEAEVNGGLRAAAGPCASGGDAKVCEEEGLREAANESGGGQEEEGLRTAADEEPGYSGKGVVEDLLEEAREVLAEAKGMARALAERSECEEMRKLKRKVKEAYRLVKRVRKRLVEDRAVKECEVAESKVLDDGDREGEEMAGEDVESRSECEGVEEGSEVNYQGLVKKGAAEKRPFGSVVVYGLPRGVPTREVANEILRTVPAARRLGAEGFVSAVKRLPFTIRCKEEGRENIIVTMPTFVWRELAKTDYMVIRGERLGIRVFLEAEQCLNCWAYGHKSSECLRETRCKWCAGFHHHKDCKERMYRCVNCVEVGVAMRATGHDARDQACPIFLNQVGWMELEG